MKYYDIELEHDPKFNQQEMTVFSKRLTKQHNQQNKVDKRAEFGDFYLMLNAE